MENFKRYLFERRKAESVVKSLGYYIENILEEDENIDEIVADDKMFYMHLSNARELDLLDKLKLERALKWYYKYKNEVTKINFSILEERLGLSVYDRIGFRFMKMLLEGKEKGYKDVKECEWRKLQDLADEYDDEAFSWGVMFERERYNCGIHEDEKVKDILKKRVLPCTLY